MKNFIQKILPLVLSIIVGISAGVYLLYRIIPQKPAKIGGGEKIVTNFAECLAAGYLTQESYPRVCRTPDGASFSEDIGNTLEKKDMIRINAPRENEIITSPLTVKGEARGAWFFEASFPVKVLDENGVLLGIGVAQAEGQWMTENFVPFTAVVEFTAPSTEMGSLILEKDNPSGIAEHVDELRVPIMFGLPVKAFFPNAGNPSFQAFEAFECTQVLPVVRIVPYTRATARAALTELLKGPSETEKSAGYFTSINTGVEIQKLMIEDGVAKVDFNAALEQGVGGSCKVASIRAQITETLKQFATVGEVIISIRRPHRRYFTAVRGSENYALQSVYIS